MTTYPIMLFGKLAGKCGELSSIKSVRIQRIIEQLACFEAIKAIHSAKARGSIPTASPGFSKSVSWVTTSYSSCSETIALKKVIDHLVAQANTCRS